MPKSKTSKTSPKGDPKSRPASDPSDPVATDAQNASGATTDAPVTTPAEAKADAKPAKKAKAPKEPREELVVFAFRLTPAERDAIHRAAGPAKASRFVRALCVHAAKGDVQTVTRIAEAVRDAAE